MFLTLPVDNLIEWSTTQYDWVVDRPREGYRRGFTESSVFQYFGAIVNSSLQLSKADTVMYQSTIDGPIGLSTYELHNI